MKRHVLFISFYFLFLSTSIYAQSLLEKELNWFRSGDELVKQQVEYKSPGDSGRDIHWDFSEQNLIDDIYELRYFSPDNDSTLIGLEHRTCYKYKISGDSLFCIGYENPTVLMNYLRPELILTFPFQYQSQSEDYFYGKGEYSSSLDLTVQGKTVTKADAFGTMTLPGGELIDDVLRTYTVKRMVEKTLLLNKKQAGDSIAIVLTDSIEHSLTADSIIYQVETYCWYAAGYRYPIFETVQTTVYIHEQITSQTNTAFLYTPADQYYELDDDPENIIKREQIASEKVARKYEKEKNENKNSKDKDRSFDSSTQKVSYSYSIDKAGDILLDYWLSDESNIAFCLYDIQGRLLLEIPESVQQGGSYQQQFTIDKNSQWGTYLLKITIDEDIITDKIVKK